MLFLVYQQPGPIIVMETQQVAQHQQPKSLQRQDGTKDLDLKLENFYEQSTAFLVT